MIPTAARHLRDLILASAQARGVSLEQRFLRLERGLPVLRLRLDGRVLRGCHVDLPGDPAAADHGYAPDVITVHGSGDRASRMWPRQRDGGFKMEAVVDHILRLAEAELSRVVPDLLIPSGIPASRSGLIILHLAAVKLGLVEPGSNAELLAENVTDSKIRERIEGHLGRGGLTDGDLHRLADANAMFASRATKIDFDPFELHSDRWVQVLRIGRMANGHVEHRYVIVLDDHDLTEFTLADPAGDGLVTFKRDELTEAWKLGAKKGVKWVGTISVS
jgi:hypothetical protein